MTLKELLQFLKDEGHEAYNIQAPQGVKDTAFLTFQVISRTPDYTSAGVAYEELRVQLNIHAEKTKDIHAVYEMLREKLFPLGVFIDSSRDDPVSHFKGIRKKFNRRIVDIKFREKIQ